MNIRTLFIFGLLVLAPLNASAARFFFVGEITLHVGEIVPVTLMLDTEGADVNALEGAILVSDTLHIASIREEGSVVSLWVERPSIEGGHTSSFSGIILGGFRGILGPFWDGGRPGMVYTLLLEGRTPGIGRVTLGPSAAVLANDGEGTAFPVRASDLMLTITSESGPPTTLPIDTEPPDVFAPLSGNYPSIFDGDYFLSFVARDAESGIDHYEVAESRTKKPVDQLTYTRAESPYRLEAQSLGSYIYIKAVDRAGNERVTIVEPVHPTQWQQYWWVTILIALLLLAGYATFRARIARYFR